MQPSLASDLPLIAPRGRDNWGWDDQRGPFIGRQRGLSGKKCSGVAPAETRLCEGCCREAKAIGMTVHKLSPGEQFRYAWGEAGRRRAGDRVDASGRLIE